MPRRWTVLLSAAAGTLCLLIGLIVGRYLAGPSTEYLPADRLAEPLPAETTADFAAAQPIIDELRLQQGSVLDGTLLAAPAESESPADNSYLELLLREARRLDSIAADHEDQHEFAQADSVRQQAAALRQTAREKTVATSELSDAGAAAVNR